MATKSSKKSKPVLPDKPSELLAIALHDLEMCEADPRYRIDMSLWHEREDGVCTVCLAGSVMAQRLNVSPTKDACPSDMSAAIYPKLKALDDFRQGNISGALNELNAGVILGSPKGIPDNPPDYDPKNPKPFKAYMRKIIAFLQKCGL